MNRSRLTWPPDASSCSALHLPTPTSLCLGRCVNGPPTLDRRVLCTNIQARGDGPGAWCVFICPHVSVVVHLCVPVLLLYVCAYCCCVARTIYRVMSLNCPSSRVSLLELCRCLSWLLARTYRLCGPTTKRFKQAWMRWRLPYSAGLPERSSTGNHGSNTKLFVGKGWSRCTELWGRIRRQSTSGCNKQNCKKVCSILLVLGCKH